MTTKTLTSPALITKAEAATGAVEDMIRKAATDWSAAYAAVAKDRKAGATAQAIADSLPKGSGCSSAATITDMERAARIAHVDAWAALWRLPVPTNGKRVTTLHGLIAKARKSAKAGAVDAAIGKALDAVTQAAGADDEDKRAARIARAYSGLVTTLNTLKPPAAPPAPPEETEETEPAATVEPATEPEPATVDGRVLALASECEKVRTVLVGGGASVTSDALVALQREAAALARDVARILAAKDAKRDAA